MDHRITISAIVSDGDADPSSSAGVTEVMYDQLQRALVELGLDDIEISSAG